MKLILILTFMISTMSLKAQQPLVEKQVEKIDYYASINNEMLSQKNKYENIADITGNTAFVLLVVTAFAYSNISVPNGNGSPNYKALSIFFATGFASCIIGTIALVFNRKAKKLQESLSWIEINERNQKRRIYWEINTTKNGIGLICYF